MAISALLIGNQLIHIAAITVNIDNQIVKIAIDWLGHCRLDRVTISKLSMLWVIVLQYMTCLARGTTSLLLSGVSGVPSYCICCCD